MVLADVRVVNSDMTLLSLGNEKRSWPARVEGGVVGWGGDRGDSERWQIGRRRAMMTASTGMC